jgi:TonB family protein
MKFFFFLLLLPFAFIFPQEGVIKTFYSNGIVESEITYLNKIRDGLAKFYYEDGTLKEERNYSNGRIEGSVKTFHKNGKLKESFFIEEGKRSGAYITSNEDSSASKTANFASGILYIPPKEEPVATAAPAKKKFVTPAPKPRKGMTYEEKIVASLEPRKTTEADTLPIDPKSGYYLSVQEMPKPVGGYEALQKKLTYPKEALDKKIEGSIVLYAYVNEDGDVTKTEVVKSLGGGLDAAAEVAVFYCRFKPGRQAGKAQKVKMLLTLDFKLPDVNKSAETQK